MDKVFCGECDRTISSDQLSYCLEHELPPLCSDCSDYQEYLLAVEQEEYEAWAASQLRG